MNTTKIGTLAVTAAIGILASTAARADYILDYRLVDSVQAKQMVADEDSLYVLTPQSAIYKYGSGFFGGRESLDQSNGTKMISARRGYLYQLKDNNTIYRREFGSWVQIDQGNGNAAITSEGRSVLVMKDNGNIYRIWDQGRWETVAEGIGARKVVVDDSGGVYCLTNQSVIYKIQNQRNWEQIDAGGGTNDIRILGGYAYSLKQNGNVYAIRRQGDWFAVNENGGVVAMDGSRDTLFTLMNDAGLFSYSRSRGFTRVAQNNVTRSIAVGNGQVYTETNQGQIYRASFYGAPLAPENTRQEKFQTLHKAE